MRYFLGLVLLACIAIFYRDRTPAERLPSQAPRAEEVAMSRPASPAPSARPEPTANPMPDWAREPERQPGYVTMAQKYDGTDPDYERRFPKFFDPRAGNPRTQRELEERHTAYFRRYAAERFYDRPTFFEGHASLHDSRGHPWELDFVLAPCNNSGRGDDAYEPGGFPIPEDNAGYYLVLRVPGRGVYTHKAVIGSARESEGRLYSFVAGQALEKQLGITALAVEIPLNATGDVRLQAYPSVEWSRGTVTWKELP